MTAEMGPTGGLEYKCSSPSWTRSFPLICPHASVMEYFGCFEDEGSLVIERVFHGMHISMYHVKISISQTYLGAKIFILESGTHHYDGAFFILAKGLTIFSPSTVDIQPVQGVEWMWCGTCLPPACMEPYPLATQEWRGIWIFYCLIRD